MKRVLVVDDSLEIRRLIRLILEHHFVVECAPDALSALEQIERQVPDVVLLDIMLNDGMTGLELLKVIRRNQQMAGCAVVMITAIDKPALYDEAMHLGANDYFIKPFSPTALMDSVDRLAGLAN